MLVKGANGRTYGLINFATISSDTSLSSASIQPQAIIRTHAGILGPWERLSANFNQNTFLGETAFHLVASKISVIKSLTQCVNSLPSTDTNGALIIINKIPRSASQLLRSLCQQSWKFIPNYSLENLSTGQWIQPLQGMDMQTVMFSHISISFVVRF